LINKCINVDVTGQLGLRVDGGVGYQVPEIVESHGQRLKEIAEGLENTEPESEWMIGSHLNQCSVGKKKVVLACASSWVAQDSLNEEEVKAQGSLEKEDKKETTNTSHSAEHETQKPWWHPSGKVGN
jgi:hypothetical protein